MIRPELEQWLARVPLNTRLAEAGRDELALLANLVAVLDGDGVPGVQGTTLAKIMHRKRPAFVPLYDRFVWRCYVGVDSAPIDRDNHRSWAQFIPLLARAMRDDLTTEGAWLDQVARQASSIPISRLRALNLVAWQAGQGITVPDEPPPGDNEASDALEDGE